MPSSGVCLGPDSGLEGPVSKRVWRQGRGSASLVTTSLRCQVTFLDCPYHGRTRRGPSAQCQLGAARLARPLSPPGA